MAEFKLAAARREKVGKGTARKLRRSGNIPGIVYGPGKEPTPVYTAEREFLKVFEGAGHTHLVDLDLAGDTRTVLIKEVERHPIRNNVLHVDFHEVRMDRVIHTSVPVVLVGEESRESDGGIVTQMLTELEVKSLPVSIPDHIEVDISKMKVGESIHVGDLKLPEGVETEEDPEEIVVSVVAPVLEAAEEAEASEPEIVGKEEND